MHETRSYDIYCPEARMKHEPHMLNFWLTSCLRRQKAMRRERYASLDPCRRCEEGEIYLQLVLSRRPGRSLSATCRRILHRRNRAEFLPDEHGTDSPARHS